MHCTVWAATRPLIFCGGGFPNRRQDSLVTEWKSRQVVVKIDHPIDSITVTLPSKTSCFLVEFRELSRARSTESSGFMERAMGIEPTSEAWEASILPLYDARSSVRA